MIECVEIINVMNIVSAKMTNILPTNIVSTASINCHIKKSKELLYFTYSFVVDHTIIDNYYCLLLLCKTKRY